VVAQTIEQGGCTHLETHCPVTHVAQLPADCLLHVQSLPGLQLRGQAELEAQAPAKSESKSAAHPVTSAKAPAIQCVGVTREPSPFRLARSVPRVARMPITIRIILIIAAAHVGDVPKLARMMNAFRGRFVQRKLPWILCAGLAAQATPLPALAQGPTEASAMVEARKLFAQGSAFYLAGKYADALEVLKASRDLVPSPNSELVIARCLRELGRLVEAQEMFASAEVEARRRAAEGTQKYEKTANSASTEGAAVRALLGTLRIRIEGVQANTKLEIDGLPSSIPVDGDVVVWHTPGDVAVSVRTSTGAEQKQVATLRAGAAITMSFAAPQPPGAREPISLEPPNEPLVFAARPAEGPTPTARESSGGSWATAAALTTGALALGGAGVFIGFHLDANSAYRQLFNSCGKTGGCGPAERSKADSGKTSQLIANVGLIAGSAAAAAALTFTIISVSHPSSRAAGANRGLRLVVCGASVQIGGDF
jgi:hypothetical protein